MARSIRFAQEINVLGLDLKATGIYTPGDPGRLSGPPEKCYPPEPAEAEVHSLTYCGEDKQFDMKPLLDSDVGEEIIEKIIDKVTEWLCTER
jgi:hypothetical protein